MLSEIHSAWAKPEFKNILVPCCHFIGWSRLEMTDSVRVFLLAVLDYRYQWFQCCLGKVLENKRDPFDIP